VGKDVKAKKGAKPSQVQRCRENKKIIAAGEIVTTSLIDM
jgi:hypothetical protein